jgi:K+-transporting ATPase ATPase A chain
VSNLFEIFLILLIPVCLTRTFGLMVKDTRQGWAILAAMATIWVLVLTGVTVAELTHHGSALQAAGGSMEGKEVRFGPFGSSLFATSTTGTSTGAVDSFHSSFSALGGGLLILNMGFGEVAPGGVGSGLYGMLVLAIVTVFVGGLMVGRTPEYLRKKIRAREIKLVSLSILTMPIVVLVGTGIAMALPGPRESILNPGAHGLSEVLYAFTSAGNNNGSAFAGLSANTTFYNTMLGFAMLLGRFLPILFVLALAGSLAEQRPVPATAGTLPTHRPLFVGMLVGVVIIVAGLTFFPALALGPLAEGL